MKIGNRIYPDSPHERMMKVKVKDSSQGRFQFDENYPYYEDSLWYRFNRALCSFLLLSQKVSHFPLSHIRHYPLLQERSLDFARDDNEDGALLSLFSCRHAKECLFEAH